MVFVFNIHASNRVIKADVEIILGSQLQQGGLSVATQLATWGVADGLAGPLVAGDHLTNYTKPHFIRSIIRVAEIMPK